MTISINRQTLAILIACAASHIEDVETGIDEGLYEKSENTDLADKKEALAAAQALIEPPECPPGGYDIMINFEQTADHCDTLSQARQRGQELCDAEPLPTTWSIFDAGGQFVEEIKRSDGKSLEAQIKDFSKNHRR